MHSPYDDKPLMEAAVKDGRHREVIGGLWDVIGPLQLEFLKASGLQPDDRLLDIGCGSLRLGTLAVNYLEPGHYFGTDLNGNLLDAGYALEISDKARLPRENLVVDANFSFAGVPSDMSHAMACSVFTHLPMNHLRRCLLQVHAKFPKLTMFCFTVFLAPSGEQSLQPVQQAGGIFSHDTSDPYHYLSEEIHFLCDLCGYGSRIVNWEHPRNQMMVVAMPRR